MDKSLGEYWSIVVKGYLTSGPESLSRVFPETGTGP